MPTDADRWRAVNDALRRTVVRFLRRMHELRLTTEHAALNVALELEPTMLDLSRRIAARAKRRPW